MSLPLNSPPAEHQTMQLTIYCKNTSINFSFGWKPGVISNLLQLNLGFQQFHVFLKRPLFEYNV